jgi:trk system potassium uptake protein TrkA
MYILVLGCGQVGARVASALAKLGNEVVVVDNSPSSFDMLDEDFNGGTLAGDCLDEDVLKEAGIEKASIVIGTTNDDNMNLMLVQIAREKYKVPRVIAKVHDSTVARAYKEEMDVETVCPPVLVASEIINLISKDT